MANVKVEDLTSKTTLLINGVVRVEISVSLADEAAGEYTKQTLSAVQDQIQNNFIKSIQTVMG